MPILVRKMASAAAHAGRHLSRFRGRPFADYIERCTDGFHRALNNVNFDMAKNGELRVVKLMSVIDPKCIFDVGANVGEWSQIASDIFPSAEIHAFEIVPTTFSELRTNTSNLKNVVPINFGLSDEETDIAIYLGAQGSTDATAFKIEGMTLHDKHYVTEVQGHTRKGIDYLTEQRIDVIDFLKIDVEGMDLRVIKGFEDAITKVRALQFEYGIFNISSHDLLADFCQHLKRYGFVVGKVFPKSVTFFDYDYNMENFHGSNYVAVRRDDTSLISALSNGSYAT